MAKYAEAGYCLIRNRADRAILDSIRDVLLAEIAVFKATPGYQANKARYHRDFAVNMHLRSDLIAGYLQGSPFREVVARVLGADADLRFTSTMTKTAEMSAHLDWHQDSAYDKDPEHDKFSFWIAITDSKRDNGCLRIIPGSHAAGLVPHIASRTLAFDKEVENLDESRAQDVEMEPGDMIVLHRYMVHASWPNRSGRLRMGLLAGFMPPKREYMPFENGAYRYFRDGRPVWSRVSDPA
jgi:ectoine hydroxylase-related dioxygenase (phytanoyl-CoA dioxygenase family)